MNSPWVYTCSPSWIPLPPPSTHHPSRSSQCISPELLYHASNLVWWCVHQPRSSQIVSAQGYTISCLIEQYGPSCDSLSYLQSSGEEIKSSKILLGHPSAPAPSTLYYALNLDWRFVSHMIIYMFQCQSPKSSHPRPLPQSPKDCSIHLCLFCCLAYRIIITLFLNSIYMH